ncbi:hypothetical protein D9756_009074 [Leucocoprinus leucothites]|uniref:Uncharacterized protein n=1 Tax=Leucocoprinus leucothites TaxID=201217 RepID=A0A8H5FVB2_9AGAR|nr:hypothetical protein D9756_009074 [Leucoagaricus leucothites]
MSSSQLSYEFFSSLAQKFPPSLWSNCRTHEEREALLDRIQRKWPELDREDASWRSILMAPNHAFLLDDVKKKEETAVVKWVGCKAGGCTCDLISDDDDDDDLSDFDDEDDEMDLEGSLPGAVTAGSTSSISSSTSSPTSSNTPIPTKAEFQQYIDSIRLTYQTLTVACIIIESYLRAHIRLHNPIFQKYGILQTFDSPPRSAPMLIECILGHPGTPAPLIPLEDLQNEFGVQFPDVRRRPPPPMPSALLLTPVNWTRRPSRRTAERGQWPIIEPTRNVRPVESVLSEGADYRQMLRIRRWLQILQGVDSSSPSQLATSLGDWNSAIPASLQPGNYPPMIGSLNSSMSQANELVRRPKRVIKPLPKRIAQSQVANSTQGAGPVLWYYRLLWIRYLELL